MSFRAVSRMYRSIRPVAQSLRTPILARRAASSGGAHAAPGSDLPWALGSAVVFVPLAGWILARTDDEHHATQPHAEDQHGDKGSAAQLVDSDTHDTGKESDDAGGKDSTEDEKQESAGDDSQEKTDSDGESKEEGAEPSAKDIKNSLERAEKTNVPRVAMSEEAKGHGTQAEADN